MVTEKTKKYISTAILSAFLILVMVGVSQLIGLSQQGFDTESILKQYFFYAASGIAFLVGILLLFFTESLITKGDNIYGDSLAYNSQEESILFKKIKFFHSNINILFISIVIFGLAGIFTVFTKQGTFTGIATLEQQFTPISSVLFSAALVPAAENLGLAFIIAFSIFLIRYLAKKNNYGSKNFIFLTIILIPIIAGIYGLANHFLRYGSTDLSLLKVFSFWLVLGLVTILTGSFIPAWVIHISNNFFIDVQRYFSSEGVLIWTVIGLIAVGVIYVLIFANNKKQSEVL